MDLILWRHAEAELLREGSTDMARCLTAKGERQAARMSDWLNHRLAASTRVLVSPAERARGTAAALGREVRIVNSIAPDASVQDLLAASRWPQSSEPVLMVGHQPTLGLLASLLLTGTAQPWAVKKGGVWWLRSRQRDGHSEVVLQAVQAPDFL
ncbi:SixA phosphatase family protein [Paucibacter sp. KCTC 42545]|uniref:SixA phosphatase family protein n=1 Tax=Paucibacter sp. KCTC 42545 TaxID=1768242 RepID=UPI000733BF40|nr:histidine phosphatase family protein [Paucibacter sp. KCTC 42545]ALT76458.1 histidine phosphatase family protein [Paucibacter sp. KCTC 42545]